MTLETNLPGRLRNTSLPLNQGLLPVYEAVVNSIHSIEDAGIDLRAGRIEVEVIRSQQNVLPLVGSNDEPWLGAPDIVGFRITDNGVGFDDANMESFRTLDSDHKSSRGGRGVGRLIWLKAFRRVEISSVFGKIVGETTKRTFLFSADRGISCEHEEASAETRKTEIFLDGFVERYQAATSKTAKSIAISLLEHCLWYFVRPAGSPTIAVLDGDTQVKLDDVFEAMMHASATVEPTKINDEEFVFTHVKLRANSSKSHSIAFCAASRLVRQEGLKGKIPGLFGRLRDGDSEFVYVCYVASTYLDERVRSERTDFDISESPQLLFAGKELSLEEIRRAVIDSAQRHLAPYLQEKTAEARERVEHFVTHRAPRYRPILKRIPEGKLAIDPTISDKDLELTLHKELADIEGQLLEEGQELLSPKSTESYPDYRERLAEYLQKADDLKKSDLASYVFHRRVILDLFAKAIERDEMGSYVREGIIHELIMPMRCESKDLRANDCNLWLIDERLAFHHYLASDKPISTMPITGSLSGKEPDITALNVFDNPMLVAEGRIPKASIVVVEIKRPLRNDAKSGEEKDPIEQALGYLNRIRKGQVTTASGRPIPKSEDIPGYCHVLCDITPSIEIRCEMHDAIRTQDGLGYFFYHKAFKAYVEVSSFDRLVSAATERNRSFFDQLGLPAAE